MSTLNGSSPRPASAPRAPTGTRSARASTVTRTVRAGIGVDTTHGAVMPPIHLSTNFLFDSPGVYDRYDYTRTANPTRDLAGDAIAELEGGCGATVTSSGMSAIVAATRLLSAGDLLIAPRDCYGGSYRLFRAEADKGTYRVEFVDPWDPETLVLARQLRPRMIWIETPSNPHLRITDIAAWATLAREIGAICVADNTFLSPVNQRPLEHGADLVVHSTTKFLNGHSDVVGGAVVAANEDLLEEVAWWTNAMGCPVRHSTPTSRSAECAPCTPAAASTRRTRCRWSTCSPPATSSPESTTRACRRIRGTRSPAASRPAGGASFPSN